MTSYLVEFDAAPSNNTVFQGTKTGDLIINTLTSNTGFVIGSTSNILLSANRNQTVFKSQYFGIGGKSNPTYALDVLGNINITGDVKKNGSDLKLTQWTNGVGSNLFIIGSNVGVGKSNPQFTLDVAGTANFSSIYVNDSQFQLSDGGLSNATYSTSNFTSNLIPLFGDSTITSINTDEFNTINVFKYQNTALSNIYAPSNITNTILSTSNSVYTTSNLINNILNTNVTASNRAFESLSLSGGTLTGTLTGTTIDANVLQLNGSNINTIFAPISISNIAYNALPKSGGTINGNLTITGDLSVNGTSTNIDTTTLVVEDSMITVNNAQVGIPDSNMLGGIEIERGDASNYYFVYQESSHLFKVGLSNDLQAIATRDDALTTGFPYYDFAQSKLVNRSITQGDVTGLDGQLNTLSNVTYSLSNVAFSNAVAKGSGTALSAVSINSNNELQLPSDASWNLIRPRTTHYPIQAMAIDSYSGNDQAVSVSLDASSNIFVTGIYSTGINTSNTVPTIYNSNAVASSLVLPNMTQSTAAFVVKYNTAGVAQFDVGIDGVGNDTATSVTTDGTGAFIVGGSYSGSRAPVIYNSNAFAATIPTLPTPSNTGAFVVKYSSAGVGLWSAAIDSANIDTTNAVAVDSTNSIILAGTISGSNGKVYETVNTDVVKTTDVSANAMVTSFVGNGSSGAGGGGVGLNASLGAARCMDVDSAGNFYYTEDDNHVVTRVTPGGLVSTFAGGRGILGSTDGVGTNARFNTPFGIAIDRVRNVAYVAERYGYRIRRIDLATRDVTVFAGNGVQGATNGTGTNASFNEPLGLGVDSLGNVFVAEIFHRIRRIDIATRAVTIFAGSGTATYVNGLGTNAGFNLPVEIRFDSADNAYVTELTGQRVRQITPTGNVTLLAGSPTNAIGDANGTGSAATFRSPWGIIVDKDNNIYVSEENGHRIRRITQAGVVTTLAGGNGTVGNVNAPGTNARFNAPQGMYVDPYNNNLVVVDRVNGQLKRVELGSPMGAIIGTGVAWQSTYDSAGNFYNATGGDSITKITPLGVQSSIVITGALGLRAVTVDSYDNIYAGSFTNGVIYKITPEGASSTFATSSTGIVHSLACDSAGTLYAAASGSLIKITQQGVVSNATAQAFNQCYGVDVDANGQLYIVVTQEHKVYKVSQAGVVTLFAGSGSIASTDGLGSNATFNYPRDCKVDIYGNLYVTEHNGGMLRKIYPNGYVTTIFNPAAALNGIEFDRSGNVLVASPGTGTLYQVRHPHIITTLAGNGTSGSVDGFGTNARFRNPNDCAVDSLGNMYIVDSNNHCVRLLTPAGNVTTFAGGLGISGYADGLGTNARFRRPRYIAVDSSNNLYVTDGNQRVRRITPSGNVTTFAGSGATGMADGLGTAASFTDLEGIAIDGLGNIYVSDRLQRAIRRITPDGMVTTFAGSTNGTSGSVDGVGTNARFADNKGISIDSFNNIIVAEFEGHRIRKITPDATVSTIAGNGVSTSVDGLGTNATINGPHDVVVDNYNNIYVCEYAGRRIRMISPSGYVRTLSGNNTAALINGLGTNASHTLINGLAIDLDGNIIICEADASHTIRKASIMRNYAYEAAVMTSSNASIPAGITTGAAVAVKYDSNGGALWAVTVDGTSVNDSATAVTVDGSAGGANAVYMVGRYGPNNANIFTGSNVVGGISLPATSGIAAYGMRITSNGVPQWTVRVDGTGAEQTLACTSDTSGNFYMAGSYSNSITPVIYNSNNVLATGISLPSTSNISAFVVKYDSNGTAQWARTIDGIVQPEIAYTVTTDINLNVYIAGSYTTNSNMSPIIYGVNNARSPITLPSTSNNTTGGFVLKYDSNGTPIDAWVMIGTSNSAIYGIATNPSTSNLVVAGMYKGSVNLYDGTMTGTSVALPSLATQTAFVTRYLPQFTSNFKLITPSNSTLKRGNKYYISNDSTSNLQINITNSNNTTTLKNFTVSGNSGAVLQWYDDWYRFV